MKVKDILKAWLDRQETVAGLDDPEEIVKEWLEEHNFDGLCCDACGCWNADLAPCDEMPLDCEPGHEGTDEDDIQGIYVDLPVDERD